MGRRVSRVVLVSITLGLLGCARTNGSNTQEQGAPVPAPSYLPPPPQVEGPRLGMKDLPSEPPFVGEAGNDPEGYPWRHPDKASLLNLLRLKRFDLLERFFDYYQAQFEADVRNERWPADAANAFDSPDPALGPLLDEWVQKSPTSFAAVLARGVHSHALGWHMRGRKYARETSAAQMAELDKNLTETEADMQRALQLRPKLQVARQFLILSAMAKGGKVSTARQILDAGLAQCRLCYGLRVSYLHSLEPRWGGSWVTMDRFVAESAALITQNPKLGLLRGAPAAERCRMLRVEKKTAEAHLACADALKYGDSVPPLVDDAFLFADEKRNAEALSRVDRALRADPQHPEALRLRQDLRIDAADYLGAARDLILVRQLEPTNDWIAARVEWMVKKLVYEGTQLVKAGKNTESAPYFQLGLQLDPDNLDLMHRQGWAARDRVDELLASANARPDDFELRLQIDHAYASKGQFGEVVKMWDSFISAHPQDPRAFYERGGAKWQLRQREEGLVDVQKACDLGFAKACQDLPTLKAMPR